MKKIYFILSLSVIALLSSCSEDYNEHNFSGYKDAAAPKNVATYTYTLATADYSTISKAVLATVTTKADSATATAIGTNKYFLSSTTASTSIPLFLKTKYPYVDEGSSATVNYNLSIDTTTIVAANKYTLVAADYTSMGTATGTPGQYKDFTSAISPDYYIPLFLKRIFNGTKGDVKLIRYQYYTTKNSQLVSVYVFNGTDWVNANTGSQGVKSFVYKGGKWLDILIYKGLASGLNDFTPVIVTGAQTWSWDGTYLCAKMSGYDSSAKANKDNENWLISPSIDLTTKSTAKLVFYHTGKFFATGTLPMNSEATLWVSTDYVSGLPGTGTWTQLTIPTYMTNNDYTFVSSGAISLKAYVGKKISLGFKYLSSTASAGTWEIQNVTVTEE